MTALEHREKKGNSLDEGWLFRLYNINPVPTMIVGGTGFGDQMVWGILVGRLGPLCV